MDEKDCKYGIKKVSLNEINLLKEKEAIIELVNRLKNDKYFFNCCKKYLEHLKNKD